MVGGVDALMVAVLTGEGQAMDNGDDGGGAAVDTGARVRAPRYQQPIDEEDWYTVYSFPAGTYMMASASLFLYFQDDVSVMDQLDSQWETFCMYHGNFFEQAGYKCGCRERDGRIIHRKQRSSNEVD